MTPYNELDGVPPDAYYVRDLLGTSNKILFWSFDYSELFDYIKEIGIDANKWAGTFIQRHTTESIGYSRYGIAWKYKDSKNWRLWVYDEHAAVPVGFQFYSDSDHRLTNALDFMNKIVKRSEVDCKIVEIEYIIYDVNFIQSKGLVKGEKI